MKNQKFLKSPYFKSFSSIGLLTATPKRTFPWGVRGGPDYTTWAVKTQPPTPLFKKELTIKKISLGRGLFKIRATSNKTVICKNTNEPSVVLESVFDDVNERLAKEEKQKQDALAEEFIFYKEFSLTQLTIDVGNISYEINKGQTGCGQMLINSQSIFTEQNIQQFCWIKNLLMKHFQHEQFGFNRQTQMFDKTITPKYEEKIKKTLKKTLPDSSYLMFRTKIFPYFISKLVRFKNQEKEILKDLEKNLSTNIRFLYFATFFENKEVIKKILTYKQEQRKQFGQYCQDLSTQPGCLSKEKIETIESLIVQGQPLLKESHQKKVLSNFQTAQAIQISKTLVEEQNAFQDDQEINETTSLQKQDESSLSKETINTLSKIYTSATTSSSFVLSNVVNGTIQQVFEVKHSKILDFYLPLQDIEALNPHNFKNIKFANKTGQWEQKLQDSLLSAPKLSKGQFDPYLNIPLLKGLSAFFPQLENSLRLVGSEIPFELEPLSDSRIDILCVVHHADRKIIPVIVSPGA